MQRGGGLFYTGDPFNAFGIRKEKAAASSFFLPDYVVIYRIM